MERENFPFRGKYRVWFFAGAEARNNRFNNFTGSFISLMTEIFKDEFDLIKGVSSNSNLGNVIWALYHSQRPVLDPQKNRIIAASYHQMTSVKSGCEEQLILTSSSSGSVVAAQVACYLAKKNRDRHYFTKPFHLTLGSSIINPDSELYRQLLVYQQEGIIGTILYDELQDEGDNTRGMGGLSRFQGYSNAFGITFPLFSVRYHGPSFLNTHPIKGHIHRRRSMTVQKAMDYIDIILVRHRLAGEYYAAKAEEVLKAHSTGQQTI